MYEELVAGKVQGLIAKRFQMEIENKNIKAYDVDLLVAQYLDALRGPFITNLAIGVNIDASKQRRQEAIKQLVSIFCKGLTY